jgi:hypothetical protein
MLFFLEAFNFSLPVNCSTQLLARNQSATNRSVQVLFLLSVNVNVRSKKSIFHSYLDECFSFMLILLACFCVNSFSQSLKCIVATCFTHCT